MSDYKERVRQGVVLASKRHKVKDIAQEIGCSRQSLHKFKQGQSMGPDLLRKTEAWLKDRGYWPSGGTGGDADPGAVVSDDILSRFDITAEELILLAKILRSTEYTPEEKTRKFKLFVAVAAKGFGWIDELPHA